MKPVIPDTSDTRKTRPHTQNSHVCRMSYVVCRYLYSMLYICYIGDYCGLYIPSSCLVWSCLVSSAAAAVHLGVLHLRLRHRR
ncbi:hypothetical protein BZA77DRAFT_304219 [Pyronema omphalodes]|nr:hypothetical protein BZA77DRAFT_304219 [Pyronema omphalodes]